MSIKIDISVGELLDKMTILEIKAERITDNEKLNNINKEREVLNQQWQQSKFSVADLEKDIAALKKINEKLWEIEDAIRDKERKQSFDDGFIELARAVYFSNDERAKIKQTINNKTGSELVEEKSYSDYSAVNS